MRGDGKSLALHERRNGMLRLMRRSARIVGYVRPGSAHRAHDQITVIEKGAVTNSWRVVEIVEESADAGARLDRPGLHSALGYLPRGEAHGLVVATLDRLTPSLRDFGILRQWFGEARSHLVVLDGIPFDTSTEQGKQFAAVFAQFGDWQHQQSVERTRDDLATRRRAGKAISRPAVADDPELLAEIHALRDRGLYLHQIAEVLNERRVPTLRGGSHWRASSIQSALGYRRSRPDRRASLLPPTAPTDRRAE